MMLTDLFYKSNSKRSKYVCRHGEASPRAYRAHHIRLRECLCKDSGVPPSGGAAPNACSSSVLVWGLRTLYRL